MVLIALFWTLVLVSGLGWPEVRASWRTKSLGDWLIDLTGLLVQGWLIPIAAGTLLFGALERAVPEARGTLVLPPVFAFALNFVLVDYAYYWNHRVLHGARLWPAHQVHHTLQALDVFGTSRNTVWTSFLIVYLWLNGALLFLLADPAPYLAALGATAGLDLWRHSRLDPPGRLGHWLGHVFILPRHHAVHHADLQPAKNFGANLNLWDRLHGTFLNVERAPVSLGIAARLSLARKLFWPFP